MLTQIRKLTAIRAIGLPPGQFGDVAPKVVSGWRVVPGGVAVATGCRTRRNRR
jgi:hypothetical protein